MTLTDAQILSKLRQLRKMHGTIYAPLKYFRGLATLGHVGNRYKKMLKKNYKAFVTDVGVKTRTSSYTQRFRKKYPGVKSLRNVAEVTGIPYRIIMTVYNRGLAAWRTGHRPGATPQQWGYARVYSYAMKGKTYYTADSDLISKKIIL